MNNIIIVNKKEFNKKKKEFKIQGKEQIQILSDFDRTLTKGYYSSKKASSIISYLRNGNYLTKDYPDKAHELFDIYHPIEIDPNISIKIKKQKMQEWWEKHFELLIESGLDLKTIKKAVKEMTEKNNLELRYNHEEFFNILKNNNIPLIIISSSIGDMLLEFLKIKGLLSNNLHIISNLLEFDKNGKSIGIKKIIHVFNKNEIEIKDSPIYKEIIKRKNILLLGDSIGDLGMIENIDYDNVIKIGFLDDNIENNLEEYKKNFDIILLNNSGMDFINDLLKELIE